VVTNKKYINLFLVPSTSYIIISFSIPFFNSNLIKVRGYRDGIGNEMKPTLHSPFPIPLRGKGKGERGGKA